MNRSDAMRPVRAWRRAALTLLLGATGAMAALPAVAQGGGDIPATTAKAATPPAWERLSPAQREQLIAPLRERWNANPAQRARMLAHAERWQQLTPEQRRRAHHGRDRLRHMSPEQRAEARATYQRMRAMPEAERKALREKLRAMTPEQRREWVRRQRGTGTHEK